MAKKPGLGSNTLTRTGASSPGRPVGMSALAGLAGMAAAAEAETSVVSGVQLLSIDLSTIADHPDNPRAELDDLSDLADSIREFGLLQPPVVIPTESLLEAQPRHAAQVEGSEYVVVAGHRRLAAARAAGLQSVDALVRPDLASPEGSLTTFLVENIQRQALQPIEEATAFQALSDLGLSQREIARRTGVKQPTVSKRVALLSLPAEIQESLRVGNLGIREAEQLAGLEGTLQVPVWEMAQKKSITVAAAQLQVEREREARITIDLAEAEARDKGLQLVADPRAISPHARVITDPALIERASAAKTLVAQATSTGLKLYTTDPKLADASVDTDRESAAKQRRRATGELAKLTPADAGALSALTSIVLAGQVLGRKEQRMAHEWLGASVRPGVSSAAEWVAQVAEAGTPVERVRVSYALWLAHLVTAAESKETTSLAALSTLVPLLQAEVAYQPTSWEIAQLGDAQ